MILSKDGVEEARVDDDDSDNSVCIVASEGGVWEIGIPCGTGLRVKCAPWGWDDDVVCWATKGSALLGPRLRGLSALAVVLVILKAEGGPDTFLDDLVGDNGERGWAWAGTFSMKCGTLVAYPRVGKSSVRRAQEMRSSGLLETLGRCTLGRGWASKSGEVGERTIRV